MLPASVKRHGLGMVPPVVLFTPNETVSRPLRLAVYSWIPPLYLLISLKGARAAGRSWKGILLGFAGVVLCKACVWWKFILPEFSYQLQKFEFLRDICGWR